VKVFKPIKSKIKPDCLNIDDDFYKHSHGMGTGEYTLCSVACEEWNYTKIISRKIITCPDCLREIEHCKKYKPNRRGGV